VNNPAKSSAPAATQYSVPECHNPRSRSFDPQTVGVPFTSCTMQCPPKCPERYAKPAFLWRRLIYSKEYWCQVASMIEANILI
jgi:hypothetical protein